MKDYLLKIISFTIFGILLICTIFCILISNAKSNEVDKIIYINNMCFDDNRLPFSRKEQRQLLNDKISSRLFYLYFIQKGN